MNLPRVRFTIRWLMVFVAVAAIAFGVLIERRHRFGRRAEFHRHQYVRLVGGVFGGFVAFDRTSPTTDWHLDMARKYENAAGVPWLPVAPDPPEPK